MATDKSLKTLGRTVKETATTQANSTDAGTNLMSLPGEIRNLIYKHVCINHPELMIARDRFILPPLARTCRKLRKEFGQFYLAAIPAVSTSIRERITNFEFYTLRRPLGTVAQSKDIAHINRTTIVITLTNTFDRYVSQLRRWISCFQETYTAIPSVELQYIIICDVRSFDYDYLEFFLARAKIGMKPGTGRPRQQFDKIFAAMDTAIEHGKAAKVAQKASKTRKRPSGANLPAVRPKAPRVNKKPAVRRSGQRAELNAGQAPMVVTRASRPDRITEHPARKKGLPLRRSTRLSTKRKGC